MKVMLRKLVGLLFPLLLVSCVSMDKRFSSSEDRLHPGVAVFLDYQAAAKKSEDFNEEMQAHFSLSTRNRFKDLIGWQRLVYTASFRALRAGDCTSIYVTENFPDRILVNCKGPYLYQSPFGYSSDEKMHLQVYIVRIREGEWAIDRSGLTHTVTPSATSTLDRGKIISRSIGLKFRKR